LGLIRGWWQIKSHGSKLLYCFWDFSEKFVGFLVIMWYLGKLAMYSTRNVTKFSTIEGLFDPNGPPFFSLKVVGWVPSCKKKIDEGGAYYFLPMEELLHI